MLGLMQQRPLLISSLLLRTRRGIMRSGRSGFGDRPGRACITPPGRRPSVARDGLCERCKGWA